jgi:hypothetical protein
VIVNSVSYHKVAHVKKSLNKYMVLKFYKLMAIPKLVGYGLEVWVM